MKELLTRYKWSDAPQTLITYRLSLRVGAQFASVAVIGGAVAYAVYPAAQVSDYDFG